MSVRKKKLRPGLTARERTLIAKKVKAKKDNGEISSEHGVLVRVLPASKSTKHKTETRIFARNIHESYCAQKGCKFFGKPAVQGVCFSRDTFFGGEWDYIEKAMKGAEEWLQQIREIHKKGGRGGDKAYIRALESHFISSAMQEGSRLDELIYLRRELALARHKLSEFANSSDSRSWKAWRS